MTKYYISLLVNNLQNVYLIVVADFLEKIIGSDYIKKISYLFA